MRHRSLALHLALFLSGAAALAYETAWGRMLHRVFGVGDLAVATVLAAFFLGLGAGAALGGRLAKRVSSPALAYAALEIVVGAWAVASLAIVPGIHHLYASVGEHASFTTLTLLRLALSLSVLLPPTLMLGATLPVLVKAVSAWQPTWETSATRLYAVNTVGAAIGAGATGLVALPMLGNRVTVLGAAAMSVIAGIVVVLAFRGPTPTAERWAELAPPARTRRSRGRPLLSVTLAAFAGLAALAGEVLWTRVLRIVVQGTTTAFAAMLVSYLFGIAAGSVLADRLARRFDATRLFGVLQLALAAMTALAMSFAAQLPRVIGLMRGQAALEPYHVTTLLASSALLLFPIALVLGTSIPLAWRIAGGDTRTAAARAGRVLAANTLGGLVGALAAGFALVPLVGSEQAILGVAVVHLLAATVALSFGARRAFERLLAVLGPTALAAVVALHPPSLHLPYLLHARNDASRAIVEGPNASIWKERVTFLEEGRNTTVTVTREGELLRLYNDGRPESGFGGGPPGFGAELAVLGALPTLFTEEHDWALVVGLGAGHTTAVLLGAGWDRVDVVELEEAVVHAARKLYEDRHLRFPLDDPRATLVVDDARARLALAPPHVYGAIVSQPSHPWLAGSSALYTREFFEEARRALRPGGVIALWVNLFRIQPAQLASVTATLLSVFPHGHAFVVEDSSFILVACEEPIPLDERVAERAREHGLEPYLDPFALDHVADITAVRELDPRGLVAFGRGAPILTDDWPQFEFALARLAPGSALTLGDVDVALRDIHWISPGAFLALPRVHRAETIVARIEELAYRPVGLARVEASLPELALTPDELDRVLGALAEARGDVRGALAHYDASALESAAYEADRLRHDERLHRDLLRVAHGRAALPRTARPLLSSAFALRRREDIAFALEVADATDDPDDGPLRDVARELLARGCEGMLASTALDAEAHRDEHVASLAMACALERGETRLSERFADERDRIRRALGIDMTRAGDDAEKGGNGSAARRFFRRALAANPGHGAAAAGLAKLLVGDGRRDEASEVLERAWDAADGLPQSRSAIHDAAASLMIHLGGDDSDETPPSNGSDDG